MSLRPGAEPLPHTACFTVTADADPGMFAKLVGALAKRGVTPARLHGALSADGAELTLDMQAQGLDARTAQIVGADLRAMVGVTDVLVGAKAEARPVGVAA